MVTSRIAENGALDNGEIAGFVAECIGGENIAGKRVLFIIPDATRSMPMAAVFHGIAEATLGKARQADILVALGTHSAMSEAELCAHLGITADERHGRYGAIGLFNHEWNNPEALAHIGTIASDQIAALSDGMITEPVAVHVNKRVLDYDLVCVVGPVFPHEVVGFSGGNKYFFPGVAGPEILNFFHWLGALISNPVINGTKDTPVRAVVNIAAGFIPVAKRAFCLNVKGKACGAIWYGSPEEAWAPAADRAAQTHIVYKDRPFRQVLALCPKMYDEIWVAGKCMYKLEPVVADGGELIIYAPHVAEVSRTHGALIKRIGYHTRDYFLAQMDRFADIPGGILAHSTHVRGIGAYEDGVEKPRVQVTLATSIPEGECREINLGYRDWRSIDPEQWRNREDDGLLLVEHAGEVLYRLTADNPAPRPFAALR